MRFILLLTLILIAVFHVVEKTYFSKDIFIYIHLCIWGISITNSSLSHIFIFHTLYRAISRIIKDTCYTVLGIWSQPSIPRRGRASWNNNSYWMGHTCLVASRFNSSSSCSFLKNIQPIIK